MLTIDAFVADGGVGLQVIDITDPANPAIVGSCDTHGYDYGVHVAGSYAFMAGGTGLQVIEKIKPITNVTYIDSNTIITTIPADFRPGTYNLHVTNSDGKHGILRVLSASMHNPQRPSAMRDLKYH